MQRKRKEFSEISPESSTQRESSEDSAQSETSTLPVKKKSRKRRNLQERVDKASYNPRIGVPKTRKARGNSFRRLPRLDHTQKFVDEHGETHDVKTSIVKKGEHLLTPKSKQAVRNKRKEDFENEEPTFRLVNSPQATPTKSVVPQSPAFWETPGKTRMVVAGEIGEDKLLISEKYKNHKSKSRPTSQPNPEIRCRVRNLAGELGSEVKPKNEGDIINQMVTPSAAVKRFSFTVTKEGLEKVRRQFDLNGGRRAISGIQAMAAPNAKTKVSANEYAKALHENANYKYEIVHGGVSDAVAGVAAATPEALNVDTWEMNNWYMPGENCYKYLAKKFPEGFTINSEVPLKSITVNGQQQYTHIPEGQIKIRISTSKGFAYNLDLNTLYRDTNPHIAFATYILKHIKQAVEKWEAEQEAKEQNRFRPQP